MNKVLRIGTRDSQLAVWQATLVQDQLKSNGMKRPAMRRKAGGILPERDLARENTWSVSVGEAAGTKIPMPWS